jgi:hypothetical protein
VSSGLGCRAHHGRLGSWVPPHCPATITDTGLKPLLDAVTLRSQVVLPHRSALDSREIASTGDLSGAPPLGCANRLMTAFITTHW